VAARQAGREVLTLTGHAKCRAIPMLLDHKIHTALCRRQGGWCSPSSS
jgi:hypothetical protein